MGEVKQSQECGKLDGERRDCGSERRKGRHAALGRSDEAPGGVWGVLDPVSAVLSSSLREQTRCWQLGSARRALGMLPLSPTRPGVEAGLPLAPAAISHAAYRAGCRQLAADY